MQKSLFIVWALFLGLLITSCSEDLELDHAHDHVVHNHPTTLKKSCSTHHHMEKLLANPEYKAAHEERMRSFEKNKIKGAQKALCASPVIVPVAIHYQGAGNANAACLVELAKRQVAILNADFNGTNSDISKWTGNASSSYPGINFGETCMKFCIADQNHPSGYGLTNGQPAVTINRTQGDFVANWRGYLNIYVQFGTGALGYAPLGGAGNGDGVVIEATAFGAGAGCGSVSPEAPYNLGRTTTHEVGHYLLLDHIWGNGCGQDDDVADTPNQNSDYSGCPSLNQSSCGSRDLHMNYMDYTNDACMYMFTAGQSTRMENYLRSSLSVITNNASNVCSEAAQNDGGGNDDGGNNGGGNDDGGNDDGGDDNGGDNGGDDTEVCDTPTSASASNVTTTSATIAWEGYSDPIRHQLRYRIPGQSWQRVNTTSTTADLFDLLPDTEYQFRVRTRCDFGWTAQTAIQSFTTEAESTGGGDDGGNDDGGNTSSRDLTVEITLDDYGSETSWYLVDENYNIISQGGPYRDGINGRVKRKNVTLDDGCYTLVVEDYYGDGICCDYGDGSARIVDANGSVVVESDGRFGLYDELNFCIDGTSSKVGKRKRDTKSKSLAKKR